MTISAENASFRYPGSDRHVFENVSLTAPAGSLTAILGPNGSGKTTLLRCMMGFLRFTSGRAVIRGERSPGGRDTDRGEDIADGEDIAGMPPKKLWSLISYVPQAKNVSPMFTVMETVLLGRAGQSGLRPSKSDVAAASEALRRLGIAGLADKRCGELSGGELQLTLIARAAAAGPRAIILDEPESNLDFRNQLIILDVMSSLAQSGAAVIFNTHYPAHALQRADSALMLRKDGAPLFGKSADIITEENIAAAFGVEAKITSDGAVKTVTPVRIL